MVTNHGPSWPELEKAAQTPAAVENYTLRCEAVAPRHAWGKMSSLPVKPGHEGFVQPSSYLRPRGQSQPMPHAELESAVDRDQRIGLVCVTPLLH